MQNYTRLQHCCTQAKNSLELIKKIIIGILLFGIITILGFLVLMANFEIFDEPTETEVNYLGAEPTRGIVLRTWIADSLIVAFYNPFPPIGF